MSEQSAAAAAALGVPEAIVERSAAARAAETGMSVDEVLSAWAGGDAVAAAPSAAEEPSTGETEPVAPVEVPEGDEAGEAPSSAGETTADSPEERERAPAPATVARAQIPAQVTAAEAATIPEVITVPTAGIKERTNFAIPRWLAALMLIIPAFALFALGGAATDECGQATELEVDVVTGEVVNCDGSKFTGSGVGGGGADFLAQGEAIYNAAPGNCAGCHGATGGGGAGPPLGGVLTTFGACEDHIEWVALGTPGFQAAGRTTYGDTDKPVGGFGVMPAFGSSLSDEQLASVAAFERVRFGGADPAETLVDCGLGPAEDGDGGEAPAEDGEGGEAPAEDGDGGEAPAEGETSTTVGDPEAGVGRTP